MGYTERQYYPRLFDWNPSDEVLFLPIMESFIDKGLLRKGWLIVDLPPGELGDVEVEEEERHAVGDDAEDQQRRACSLEPLENLFCVQRPDTRSDFDDSFILWHYESVMQWKNI